MSGKLKVVSGKLKVAKWAGVDITDKKRKT